ncbi:MAG: YaeQ family protein [Deltaproteobacteria bacterium]|nr:YaeQ family protein [Deltaproteobacteria bacterium]
MHRLELDLSDSTRSVWEHLELRLARHPSESDGFFGARILAFALCWEPGLELGEDLSTPDAPALELRTQTLEFSHWIDVGVPSAKRLNLATRSAPRVSVFCHRDPAHWLKELRRERVQAPDRVEVTLLEHSFAESVGAALGRRGRWSLMRDDELLQVVTEAETHEGVMRVLGLDALLAS